VQEINPELRLPNLNSVISVLNSAHFNPTFLGVDRRTTFGPQWVHERNRQKPY